MLFRSYKAGHKYTVTLEDYSFLTSAHGDGKCGWWSPVTKEYSFGVTVTMQAGTVYPTNNAVGASPTSLIYFEVDSDEAMVGDASKKISLKGTKTGQDDHVIDVLIDDANQVLFEGKGIAIDLTDGLKPGFKYEVSIEANAIRYMTAAFTTGWSFTVREEDMRVPKVLYTTPETASTLNWAETTAPLVFMFSEELDFCGYNDGTENDIVIELTDSTGMTTTKLPVTGTGTADATKQTTSTLCKQTPWPTTLAKPCVFQGHGGTNAKVNKRRLEVYPKIANSVASWDKTLDSITVKLGTEKPLLCDSKTTNNEPNGLPAGEQIQVSFNSDKAEPVFSKKGGNTGANGWVAEEDLQYEWDQKVTPVTNLAGVSISSKILREEQPALIRPIGYKVAVKQHWGPIALQFDQTIEKLGTSTSVILKGTGTPDISVSAANTFAFGDTLVLVSGTLVAAKVYQPVIQAGAIQDAQSNAGLEIQAATGTYAITAGDAVNGGAQDLVAVAHSLYPYSRTEMVDIATSQEPKWEALPGACAPSKLSDVEIYFNGDVTLVTGANTIGTINDGTAHALANDKFSVASSHSALNKVAVKIDLSGVTLKAGVEVTLTLNAGKYQVAAGKNNKATPIKFYTCRAEMYGSDSTMYLAPSDLAGSVNWWGALKSRKYTVHVPANSVKDAHGNQNKVDNTALTWMTSSDDSPKVQWTSWPYTGESINPRSTIVLTFNEDVKPPKQAVDYKADGVTKWGDENVFTISGTNVVNAGVNHVLKAGKMAVFGKHAVLSFTVDSADAGKQYSANFLLQKDGSAATDIVVTAADPCAIMSIANDACMMTADLSSTAKKLKTNLLATSAALTAANDATEIAKITAPASIFVWPEGEVADKTIPYTFNGADGGLAVTKTLFLMMNQKMVDADAGLKVKLEKVGSGVAGVDCAISYGDGSDVTMAGGDSAKMKVLGLIALTTCADNLVEGGDYKLTIPANKFRQDLFADVATNKKFPSAAMTHTFKVKAAATATTDSVKPVLKDAVFRNSAGDLLVDLYFDEEVKTGADAAKKMYLSYDSSTKKLPMVMETAETIPPLQAKYTRLTEVASDAAVAINAFNALAPKCRKWTSKLTSCAYKLTVKLMANTHFLLRSGRASCRERV